MLETERPITIVIFGASGDLTWRKLVPALYNNFNKGRLDACIHVVGFARRPISDEEFCDHLKEGVILFSPETFVEETWEAFSKKLHYIKGDLEIPEDFARLGEKLIHMEKVPVNRLYYLATAPEYYLGAVENLGSAGLADQSSGWRRIVIEKPFGSDLQSAKTLNAGLHKIFNESQVYRIDHFLGKETAQNILFFRFANTIFEPVWNRRYVDNIQITVTESVDVGHRAGYYDNSGVLRDMFQNHLLQLLALVAMEPPSSFSADALRNEKVKVFESIRPITSQDTVRGQYEEYQQTEGVPPDSQTPTYAALKLFIDNWRWKGVPFYLRSGKSLHSKTTEIIIEFQRPPHLMFAYSNAEKFLPNILSLCIQPDEGIHLQFEAKLPDSDQDMLPVDMDFHYRDSFHENLPDAYERLLMEALEGDASLFTRSDMIEATWRLIDPVLLSWEGENQPKLFLYSSGSWGPVEADRLLERDRRIWRLGCSFDDAPSE
ncbi:MAG: glucose-6-phosphate dehydrogenase [Chloroflexota bacterium]